MEELAFLERIEKGMQEFNVFYPKRLLYMFHTALKSASLSPLSVLSGVSGTGKSELPSTFWGAKFFKHCCAAYLG
ncbi:hypothetical protein ACQJ69_03065 [Helicobacter pylori]